SAAEARWEEVGVNASQFNDVQFQIAAIGNSVLGNTLGNVITIDASADGFGWFVDPTPMTDGEFQPVANSTNLQATALAAMGRMDLLTVVEHELGHILGLP